MLALRPGLEAVDLGDRVWGEEAALRDALRRLEDVLRCSISFKHDDGKTAAFSRTKN